MAESVDFITYLKKLSTQKSWEFFYANFLKKVVDKSLYIEYSS